MKVQRAQLVKPDFDPEELLRLREGGTGTSLQGYSLAVLHPLPQAQPHSLIIGYLIADTKDAERRCKIGHVYTHPLYMGGGVCTALLERYIDATSRECTFAGKTQYYLENVGGAGAYKCYTRAFT